MAPLLCPIDIGRVRRVGSPRTGSGNKSQLVAIESARLEQRPACCIVFLHC